MRQQDITRRNASIFALHLAGVPHAQIAATYGTTEQTIHERLTEIYRCRIQAVWEAVSKPVKFPDRRRREDRELPTKAA